MIPKFWERTETLRRWQPVIRTTCMSSVDRNSPVDGAKCAKYPEKVGCTSAPPESVVM